MRTLILSLLIFSPAAVFSQSDSKDKKYSKEPEANFEVLVNDKRYVVSEGMELSLDTLIKPKIIIRQSGYKKFENSSLTFEYPRHLAFEFNESVGLNTWTLSGNNTVVIVFQLAGKGFLETLVDGISEKFGKENCTVESFEKKLGSKLCKGKSMKITLAGESLRYDCYELASSDSFSNYIFIQDSLEEMKHTSEYESLLQHMDSTIMYK